MNYDEQYLGVMNSQHPANLNWGDMHEEESRRANPGDYIHADIKGSVCFGQVEEITENGNYIFWDEASEIERWCTDEQITAVNPRSVV